MKRIEENKTQTRNNMEKEVAIFRRTNILNSVLADDRELIIYLPNSVSNEMVHGKCASILHCEMRTRSGANEEVSTRVPIIRFHLFPANRVRMARLNCIKFIRCD